MRNGIATSPSGSTIGRGTVGGIGFVTASLNSSEVRTFKKELKGLLEDPIVLSDQVDQFLGPNVLG